VASVLPPAERRSVVLVTIYVAISLLMLVVGERIPASGLRGFGAVMFAPFDRVAGAADRLFTSWNENTGLHARIARLETENARLRVLAADAPRLREQLGLGTWRGLTLQPVEVLALGGGDPVPSAATLSAGRSNGVQVGDAVLTSDGLIGRVSEAWDDLSRATLLTDPNQAVACEVETTGVHGILRFIPTPRPRLVLSAVGLADTVRVGEMVVTSDLSLRYPRGIPVGRVSRIEQDPTGLMQEIELTPAARLGRLRHAFVAPGPRPPSDGIPRPKLEFEPSRVRERMKPDTVLPASPPAKAKPKSKPAFAEGDTTGVEL
jgi:rod shape-determining protein MreC